jgi:hypothetical protein
VRGHADPQPVVGDREPAVAFLFHSPVQFRVRRGMEMALPVPRNVISIRQKDFAAAPRTHSPEIPKSAASLLGEVRR